MEEGSFGECGVFSYDTALESGGAFVESGYGWGVGVGGGCDGVEGGVEEYCIGIGGLKVWIMWMYLGADALEDRINGLSDPVS